MKPILEDTWRTTKKCMFHLIKRVRLEGVYLKRKYSHCPILMECKFLCCVVSRLFIFYFDPILASGWKLRSEANRKSTYFWRHKMTMGGWYWWISFKGDRLTSEHKLGVALNAFYINCTPFENEEKRNREKIGRSISWCAFHFVSIQYLRNMVINCLTIGLIHTIWYSSNIGNSTTRWFLWRWNKVEGKNCSKYYKWFHYYG